MYLERFGTQYKLLELVILKEFRWSWSRRDDN